MPTYTQSWSPVTDGILTFTNISVAEVTAGNVDSFVLTSSAPVAASGPDQGIQWNGFSTLTYGAESTQTLTFNYDVTSGSGTDLISSINSQYVIDLLFGTNAHLVATANVYDNLGNLIGSQYYSSDGVYPGVQLRDGAAVHPRDGDDFPVHRRGRRRLGHQHEHFPADLRHDQCRPALLDR